MKKGITLIETVVAVTVLTFALGGPFLLAGKSLRSAAYAREEIAAARLGEEGLEAIHNMRDNNSSRSVAGGWVNNISACTTGCLFDATQQVASGAGVSLWGNAALTSCSGTGCEVYQNPANGFYRQSASVPVGWLDTGMKRIIRITQVNASSEYTVEVEIDYPAGPQIRQIMLHDTLMNWFPALPI